MCSTKTQVRAQADAGCQRDCGQCTRGAGSSTICTQHSTAQRRACCQPAEHRVLCGAHSPFLCFFARACVHADLAKLLSARACTAAGRAAGSSSQIKALISVPRLNGGRMGVLATRSPHRPVPIGLSTAQASRSRAWCLAARSISLLRLAARLISLRLHTRHAQVASLQPVLDGSDTAVLANNVLPLLQFKIGTVTTACPCGLANLADLCKALSDAVQLCVFCPPDSLHVAPAHVCPLCLLQIVSVDAAAGVLVLGGVDIVDGSPVLDIKPYVPFSDALPCATAPSWVTVSMPRSAPAHMQHTRPWVWTDACAPNPRGFGRLTAASMLCSTRTAALVSVSGPDCASYAALFGASCRMCCGVLCCICRLLLTRSP